MQNRLPTNDIVETLVEVTLPNPEAFSVCRETLTRIGIASKKDNTLYQSCHILHKKGRYYIVHFKELFLLDGKATDITEDDLKRRNTIVNLLDSWGIVTQVDPIKTDSTVPLSHLKVLSFKEKKEWYLQSKYTVGNNKSPPTISGL
jgi:hypothetical protein